MDTLSKGRRSALMSRIRGDDLGPETRLRMALVRRGIRFRRNVEALPGSPDFVFNAAKLAVFVHGCFWHGHPLCYRAPKSNRKFWRQKLNGNRRRDARVRCRLRKIGYSTAIVRECAIRANITQCAERIASKL